MVNRGTVPNAVNGIGIYSECKMYAMGVQKSVGSWFMLINDDVLIGDGDLFVAYKEAFSLSGVWDNSNTTF